MTASVGVQDRHRRPSSDGRIHAAVLAVGAGETPSHESAVDPGAAAAGWLTLRVLGEEVEDVPDDVVDEIVEAYRMRAALHGRLG